VLGLKEVFGDRQSDAKASGCEAGVAGPNPWDWCRHDELILATWRSARQRRAVTNHDLIDAALGVLDHHAKSLPAPQTLHPRRCATPSSRPARINASLPNRTSLDW
jgi:hypothetical protein